jgi:GDP-L-fucose synthase
MTTLYDLSGKRIWVAGHRGMVGAALVRRLQSENCEILTASRSDTDLLRQADVEGWLKQKKPHAIIVAAAKVGGIAANAAYPAEFLYDNLMIEANIIRGACEARVEKLLFLGSSCIYPKFAPQPITEDALLTGALEPTNEWYAVAKIAGIKLCQAYRAQYGVDFISAMPTNLYGPNDNFSLETSHVIPALMRKADAAKQAGADHMTIWGSGTPRREFLHVDDCADALVHLLKRYSDVGHVNVGSGSDVTIEDVARLIARIVGFRGRIERDLSKPDGTPRKLMSNAKLVALGWQPRITLEYGLRETYAWYRTNLADDGMRR